MAYLFSSQQTQTSRWRESAYTSLKKKLYIRIRISAVFLCFYIYFKEHRKSARGAVADSAKSNNDVICLMAVICDVRTHLRNAALSAKPAKNKGAIAVRYYMPSTKSDREEKKTYRENALQIISSNELNAVASRNPLAEIFNIKSTHMPSNHQWGFRTGRESNDEGEGRGEGGERGLAPYLASAKRYFRWFRIKMCK